MVRFDYMGFTKRCLDAADGPLMATHLTRQAIDSGAEEQLVQVQSKIRRALECHAGMADYKRVRVSGIKGYQYVKTVAV